MKRERHRKQKREERQQNRREAALFNGTDKDMTFVFSHYQRFNTEVKDLQQVTFKPKP